MTIDERPRILPRPEPGTVRQAFLDSAGAGGALAPLGLAFGLLVVNSGFEWWWASVFTAVVYAGSLEFLLVGLIAAAAPLSEIAITSFLVNIRHVFYALSFPLHRVRSRSGRLYATFALTDEAYAITATRPSESWSGARILWVQLFCQLYWVGGATAGAFLGARVGVTVPGVDFALTALFVVLAIDAIRAGRDIPTPVLALLSALIGMLLSREHMLLIAMSLLTAGLLARFALRQRRRSRQERTPQHA